ncbi:hypothetical protein [Klenkia brasiliensis]|nr:hypothetical protein [Klenkia brasiliensis]
MPVGTYGKISFLPTEGGAVIARARFRDIGRKVVSAEAATVLGR